MVLLALPFFVAVGALLTLVLSAMVGLAQPDRRAGMARASRLIAMMATCIPILFVIRALFQAPEYLGSAFFFLPVMAGCWLVAVLLERRIGEGPSSDLGLNPDRSFH